MYNNELKLFQKSIESIWTDGHISKSLLEAHLDESSDAASRKHNSRLDIVNWINSKIRPNSNIIDLGCGPGLYAYELGKLEHNVMGIDFNRKSIDYALKNKFISGKVEYQYLDYIKDDIQGRYDVGMMIFCDFGALIPDDQKIILQRINNLLTDDGIFIFDVFGKSEIKNKKSNRNWYISNGNDFWSKDPYILMEEIKLFEKEFALGTRYYLLNQKDGKIKEYIMWDQYYDENILKELMSKNGFEIMEISKDTINYKEETLLIMVKKKKL